MSRAVPIRKRNGDNVRAIRRDATAHATPSHPNRTSCSSRTTTGGVRMKLQNSRKSVGTTSQNPFRSCTSSTSCTCYSRGTAAHLPENHLRSRDRRYPGRLSGSEPPVVHGGLQVPFALYGVREQLFAEPAQQRSFACSIR